MKNLWILCFVTTIFSCNNKKEATENNNREELIIDSSEVVELKPQYNPETELYIWHTTADYKKIKNPALSAESSPNVDSLLLGLNEYYENIYLEKIKQSGDTLYTIIKDNKYLGSQMGSTGAEVYLADVILNLTSVSGIKYVRIDMDEADHISSGIWSAQNFSKYKEAIK